MDAYLKDQFDFTGVKEEQSILVILRDNKPDIFGQIHGNSRWWKRRSRNVWNERVWEGA